MANFSKAAYALAEEVIVCQNEATAARIIQNKLADLLDLVQRREWLLRQIMLDLPKKRDWLNPDLEKEAKQDNQLTQAIKIWRIEEQS